ncbi:hypothetical protein ZHAS_00011710 [Anopheles sinensis]|uniref:Uncharacterized protein n=1 Tax=Anopheles sinensis TaxID=74873 RepID=A0A084W0W6_ANOSI|nr:hypothetical protein ZHAS_00011710 [Anopheles sinensis]
MESGSTKKNTVSEFSYMLQRQLTLTSKIGLNGNGTTYIGSLAVVRTSNSYEPRTENEKDKHSENQRWPDRHGHHQPVPYAMVRCCPPPTFKLSGPHAPGKDDRILIYG